jgi:hypothetical protein
MAVDDSNTVMLLHCNGPDASTNIKDESDKVWTARDNAQIDTAQSVFGGASLLLDGAGDWIDTPDHADINFGSGNHTTDFRMRWAGLPAAGNAQVTFCQYDAVTDRTLMYLLNTAGTYTWEYLSQSGGVNQVQFARTTTVAIDTWYHIAVTRSGNDWRIFQDGTQVGATETDATALPNLSAVYKFGSQNNDFYHNGWFDEIRVSNVARWTANFTPPTSAYGPPASGSPIFF